MLRLLPLLVLTACGMSEDAWNVKGVERWCTERAACEGTFEVEACIDVVRSEDTASCDFDPKSARDCFKSLESGECSFDDDFGTSTFVQPEVCDLIWSC